MKKYAILTLALVTMVANASLNAEGKDCAAQCAQKPQVVAPAATAHKVSDAMTTKLSAEEQSFAAKLNDQNRKDFADKLNAEQRKVAMTAAKVSTAPNAADEAVSKLLHSGAVATDKKEGSAVVVAETTEAAKSK